MNAQLTAPMAIIKVCRWEDQTTEDAGFDPRSQYAEAFWLPILGPSTMWFLRNLAQRFDDEPHGFELNVEETSQALGIGTRGGTSSAFHRTVNRMLNFGMAQAIDESTIAVRRVMPRLHRGQVRRLSPSGRRLHEQLTAETDDRQAEDRSRATQVAGTLLELGDSPDLVEQQLVIWGVQPALARDAVNHAWAAKARADAARAEVERADWFAESQ